MANDENKIILEFPATNVEIEFGETITFDNISGFLNSDRVTYNGESLTEEIAHLENDKADNTKIAPEYDEEETYYRGDIVLYNGVLYECDNTDASGEFSPSDWKEITLGEGIEDVRDLLANYYTKSQIDLHFLGKTNPSGTGYLSLNRRGSTGAYSVSVGRLNEASAQSSFAEGENNTSSGYAAHSEGYGNNASGLMAHAEGVTTESSGYGSHSEGVGTIANHIGQHVFGTYNVADTSTAEPTAKGNYIEVVGNGTDDDRRRNARTLDWRGNETLMGDLTYNGNKSLTSEISRLDGKIDNLPEPMVLKGTLGVGGTIESLPTASAENEGWTFKCITAGTYAGLTLKVGDTVTCFNPPNTSNYYWDKTGSQDTDTDTWRNIKVNGTEELGSGISSGSVDFVGSENIDVEFDSDGNKIGVKTKNIYTKEEVDDIVYDILPDDTASGSIANFETDLAMPIKSLEVDVNAVQASGTPTPSVPIPISGSSSATVFRTGKNLLPRLAETVTSRTVTFTPLSDGKIRINGTAQGGAATCDVGRNILLLPAGTYYVNETVSTYSITVFKIVGGTATPIKSGGGSFTLTETTSVFVRIAVPQNITVTNFDVALQLELGSAATTYEAYNGTSVVIPFGDTYYGGVLDVVRGKLRVTHQYKDLGSFTWVSETSAVSGLFRTMLTNCKWRSVMLCSAYKYSSTTLFDQVNDLEIALTNSEAFPLLRCRNVAYDTYTATQFKNAVMGVQLVYELATPIEIDLTPAQITTLIGTNNIYADTGDTSVVFKDSVNGYVEKKIASVQALILS